MVNKKSFKKGMLHIRLFKAATIYLDDITGIIFTSFVK